MLKVDEVALVTNMQSIGPSFLVSSKENLSQEVGMLLAARLVITVGIGNQAAENLVLYGPLPVPEIEDKELDCYIFTSEIEQKPIPKAEFSTGRGIQIFAVLFQKSLGQIHEFRSKIEKIMLKYPQQIKFAKTISGQVDDELRENAMNVVKRIHDEIDTMLQLNEQYRGGSLFDVVFLTHLPKPLSKLGKQLIMEPRGTPEQQIEDQESLETLCLVGLVEREYRSGDRWIIPK